MTSQRAYLSGIGTAVPEHLLLQADARELASQLFTGVRHLERLLTVFANSGVERRYLAMPPAWYLTPHTFPEKNQVWERVALQLAEQASREALAQAGLQPDEIGTVLFASTTGIATPSLDSYLIKSLDLPRTVARVPVWGLGCAGGVSSLARAVDLVKATGSPALVVAVELCSITLIAEDLSKTNFVGTSLFGDGAAAVIVSPDKGGPEVLGGFSRLFDESEGIVAWDLVSEGLKVRLARTTPDIVNEHLRQVLCEGLRERGMDLADIRHYALHPGGAKVLTAYQKALGLPPEALAASRGVLRDYGNISSPTSLFSLQRILDETPACGQPGLLLAPGPGFSVEGVSFVW